MATHSLRFRYQIIFVFCTISLVAIQDGLSFSLDSDRSAIVNFKRFAPYAASLQERAGEEETGAAEAAADPAPDTEAAADPAPDTEAAADPDTNTEAAADATTPNTTADSTNTTTTTTAATTLATPSFQQPMANISDFIAMNYSYSDQTTFENGTNDWDFTGTWSKTNLYDTEEEKRPVPLYVEGEPDEYSSRVADADNSTDSAADQDQNNFVMIYTVDEFSQKGLLQKSFERTGEGEVFIRYYALLPGTAFNVTLVHSDDKQVQLYSSIADGANATVAAWTARRFQFTEEQTLNREYTLVLSVAAPADTAMGKPVLAVQHIAVGGMWPGGTPPSPTRPSNETVSPPGSAPYLEGIAYSIYTALYVFLAFFLLVIVALVVVIVRGRLR